MAETLKDKLSVKDKWIRLIFMIIFALVVYWVVLTIAMIIATFQFFYTLFVGKANRTLLPFSSSLGDYIQQIVHYLTYNSETKPFPFTPWPGTAVKSTPVKAAPKKTTAKKVVKKK